MKPECQALLLQEQLTQIQQALNAMLIKQGAQAPTEPPTAPTVVYRNVVESRRSGARRVIFQLLNTKGSADVYSISTTVYGNGESRNITRTRALLYALRGARTVWWEGPLRMSTIVRFTDVD